MKNYLSLVCALVIANQAFSLEAVTEDELRDVSGQNGKPLRLEVNFKGTVGRAYYSDSSGDSLNLRNISVDTDGSNHGDTDRPINLSMAPLPGNRLNGWGIDVSGINDLDVSFEQLNVNGDVGSGAITAENNSYGGIALNNINDNGGNTQVMYIASGASGREGITTGINFAEVLSFQFAYTDYGADPNASNDDHNFSADIILNNFVVRNTIDLVSGTDFNGQDVGGLRIGVEEMSGDISVRNIQAGSNAGSLGRVVLNNYRVSPESYLIVQGK